MCPHLNNNFTPVADNLPPAVVRSAESAGGSQFTTTVPMRSDTLPTEVEGAKDSKGLETGGNKPLMRNRTANEVPPAIGSAVGNTFEASGDTCGTGLEDTNTLPGDRIKHAASQAPGPLASFPIPHICISCGQTLRAKQDASRVVVYCGYGPCKSKAANEGAFGRTVEEAVDELNALILEED